MRALFQPSIARRLMVALLLASVLVWGAIYALGRAGVYAAESGSFDRDLFTLSEAARRVLDTPGLDPATALAGLALMIDADTDLQGFTAGYLAFQVHGPDGAVIARGGQGPHAVPVEAGGPGFFDTEVDGTAYRVHRRWSADGRHRVDTIQSMVARQQTFDAVMFSSEGLLQPVLIGFTLVLLPVWLAVYSGLQPLRRLSRELASRKPSDLQAVQVPPVYRELAPVVHELNGTFGRLRTLLQRERDFLADAAHELRTPLAVIGAQCETLMRSGDTDARDAAAQRLNGGVARATRLVHQLLALARLDADVVDRPRPVDLADVTRDGLAAHAPAALARGIELAYTGPDSLVVPSQGHAFESVLDNLVGNAVRYGRAGGRVEVTLATPSPGWVRLDVRDDGRGIPPGDRERLFERFRRGADPGASGSGLGLAIVAAAARQVGARIDVTDGLAGRGAGFVLTWPVP